MQQNPGDSKTGGKADDGGEVDGGGEMTVGAIEKRIAPAEYAARQRMRSFGRDRTETLNTSTT